jgi:Mrp family chromosome partitioning ATPase
VGAGRDAVVIDSPPVLSVSDSLWLVRHVDGVILVLSTRLTAQANARQAKARIEEAGGRVLGVVVLNRFDERLHRPGFHLCYAYYEIEFDGSGLVTAARSASAEGPRRQPEAGGTGR